MTIRTSLFHFLLMTCCCLATIITLLAPTPLQAQPIEIGVRIGASNYLGDVAPMIPALGETKLSTGGFLSYHFDKQLAARISFNRYRLTGSDANLSKPWAANRNLMFVTTLSETSLALEYYLRPFSRCSKQWTPYVSAGLAHIHYNRIAANFAVNDASIVANGAGIRRAHSLSVPFGIGVKKVVYKGIAIGAEANLTRSFTDQLDIPKEAGRKSLKDYYMFGGITLSYLFGSCNDYRNRLFPTNVDCFEFEHEF